MTAGQRDQAWKDVAKDNLLKYNVGIGKGKKVEVFTRLYKRCKC